MTAQAEDSIDYPEVSDDELLFAAEEVFLQYDCQGRPRGHVMLSREDGEASQNT